MKHGPVADVNTATERLSDAMQAKNDLLRAYATGRPARADELRAAEEAVRVAELDATLQREVAKFVTAERERAEIAAFQATADALAEEMADRASEHIEAARALDVAMDAARAAAQSLSQARMALEVADRAAHAHNALVTDAARSNAILSAAHRSTWPKARTASQFPSTFGLLVRPELVTTTNGPRMTSTGPHDTVVHGSAEQIARGAQSTLPKPVAAAA